MSVLSATTRRKMRTICTLFRIRVMRMMRKALRPDTPVTAVRAVSPAAWAMSTTISHQEVVTISRSSSAQEASSVRFSSYSALIQLRFSMIFTPN